jgi:DNA-binding transcriptional regulator YhcF (GntR family)
MFDNFDEIYWKENKGMFVTKDNKDYFVYGSFNDEQEFVLFINKGQGKFVEFNKNDNKEEYIYLLEKLSNYNITRYIFNNIIDTFNKLGIKHNMIKR